MNISDVFTKKIWNVRLSEFPNRRKLVPTDEDNVYDVERHEGEVIEKGDLISNQALNDLENRIQNGFQAVIKSGGANIVKLWENPDPTVEFPEQEITLASSDYDILEVFFKQGGVTMSNRGFADSDILTSYNVAGLDANGKHTAVILCRGFAYINNMKYRVESCIDSRDGSTRNNLMIPYRIYGYKISGKYPTDPPVQPDTPSEPDNNAQNNIYSYDEVRIGTWIDGKPLYRKMFDLGALPNNTIKTIAHNIPDIDTMYIDLGNSFFINDANTDTYSLSHINIHAIRCNKNDIYIQTNTDLRAFNGFTCLNYTKTTDKAGN